MTNNKVYMHGILNTIEGDFHAIVRLGPREDNELRILRQKWQTELAAVAYLVRFYITWVILH